jgi:hypothetical protein
MSRGAYHPGTRTILNTQHTLTRWLNPAEVNIHALVLRRCTELEALRAVGLGRTGAARLGQACKLHRNSLKRCDRLLPMMNTPGSGWWPHMAQQLLTWSCVESLRKGCESTGSGAHHL